MKGVLVILDGLGDLPCKQLGDKTPLEAAKTPNLDFFAARGEFGYMHPVKPNFVPSSDEATISIFGNELSSSSRGQLEASGVGIKVSKGDLAMRANFSTIESSGNGQRKVIDRRAGRTLTTVEAAELAESLNRKIKLPVKFVFEPTLQHRGVLVFRGGLSDNITNNDPHTHSRHKFPGELKVMECKSKDDDENSQYTANIVNEFLDQAYEILDKHPVNEKRRRKGLMPANHILVRGFGAEIPQLRRYSRWMAVAYMNAEKGFANLSKMRLFSFDYPKMKKLDAYKNLSDGLKKACSFSVKTLKKNHKNYDYAYVHIKEVDTPGHDNKPLDKKEMIERIDKTVFKFLRKFAPAKGISVVVTGDHSTPCKFKNHSADPVPVLFYDATKPSMPKEKHFDEMSAKRGALGSIRGPELLKRVGFVR